LNEGKNRVKDLDDDDDEDGPFGLCVIAACKRKEEVQTQPEPHPPAPKKPRLVFTDLQRRTLQAIFKVSPFSILSSRLIAFT
jgi:hypothetical protein